MPQQLASYQVAAVSVYHETNTFSPIPTGLHSFRDRWLVGEQWRTAFNHTRTVGGGFIAGAQAQGFRLIPAFGAFATPAGTVTSEAADTITSAVCRSLEECSPVDAVLLELHGAMVAEGFADFEDSLIEAMRRIVGDVPIAGVTDLHANLACDRLSGLDILTGYRTNPHVDTFDRGYAAASFLARVLEGELKPLRKHAGVRLVVAPAAQRTADGPLATILCRARELERDLGLVELSVHGGYAYADVPYLGMGFTATADESNSGRAEGAVAELRSLAVSLAHAFELDLPDVESAFADAASRPGLAVLADTGDNINGGAPGDSTWLLAEALRHPHIRTLATVWDPAALEKAKSAGVGAQLRLELGGHSCEQAGPPIPVQAQVLSIGDGEFINTGPMATGARVSMGGSAVIRVGNCDILIQLRSVQPNDPEMFRSVGEDPASYDVALLKGAAAIRAGWASLTSRFIDVASPGVCDSRLDRLTYVWGRGATETGSLPGGSSPLSEG